MFIGRRDYLSDLETLWRKRTSSIVACRGRRRIGKSTLIREFAKRTADAYIEIEGLPPSDEVPVTNRDQLDHFVTVLNDQTGCGFRPCERWYDAFSLLEKQIDDGKRTVVLLDEISWMGGYDKDFPSYLKAKLQAITDAGNHPEAFARKCLMNVACAGKFSSDRTIRQYAKEIWDV